MTGLWAALLLFVQGLNANRQPWVVPLPDVSLQPARAAVSAGELGPDSAYGLLLRATELPVEDESLVSVTDWLDRLQEAPFPRGAEWTEAELTEIQELLRAVAPNLAFARQAAAEGNPQVPRRHDWSKPVPSYLRHARTVARILAVKAYWREGQGDPAGALDELLAGIRLGDVLSRDGCFLDYCVDVRISRLSADPIWRIATRNDLPAPVLARAARELLDLADHVEPLAEAFRLEAANIVSLSDEVARLGPNWVRNEPARHPVLRRVLLHAVYALTGSSQAMVKRDLQAYCQHLVRWAEGPHSAAIAKQARWTEDWHSDRWLSDAILAKRDPVGLCIAAFVTPALVAGMDDAADRDAVLRGTALYLAIRAYESRQGRPPARLPDLVPDYLPRVPLDPFDGTPFRYQAAPNIPESWGEARWGIYSIGRDFADNHGALVAPIDLEDGRGGRRPNTDLVWLPQLPPRPRPELNLFDE